MSNRAYMITLEAFKKILGEEAQMMTQDEIELLYSISIGFADLTYKKWIESRRIQEPAKC